MSIRFLVSVVVIFILSLALGFVVHGTLLGQAYANLPQLFRAEIGASSYIGVLILAHAILAVGFVGIYRMTHDSDAGFLVQGSVYGIAIAALAVVPTYLIYYAAQPMPLDLVIRQIVYDTISVLIMGVVVAAMHKST